MYTKKVINHLFFPCLGAYTEYYKNGKYIGARYYNGVTLVKPHSEPCEISRAQAFKYWERHFSGLPCWLLPKPLEDALDKPVKSNGVYWSKRRREYVGYSG